MTVKQNIIYQFIKNSTESKRTVRDVIDYCKHHIEFRNVYVPDAAKSVYNLLVKQGYLKRENDILIAIKGKSDQLNLF